MLSYLALAVREGYALASLDRRLNEAAAAEGVTTFALKQLLHPARSAAYRGPSLRISAWVRDLFPTTAATSWRSPSASLSTGRRRGAPTRSGPASGCWRPWSAAASDVAADRSREIMASPSELCPLRVEPLTDTEERLRRPVSLPPLQAPRWGSFNRTCWPNACEPAIIDPCCTRQQLRIMGRFRRQEDAERSCPRAPGTVGAYRYGRQERRPVPRRTPAIEALD